VLNPEDAGLPRARLEDLRGGDPAGAPARLRASGLSAPLVLMGYANPLVAMGWERFAERAARAGVDGAIVPDLPLEEAEPVSAVLAAAGFDLVLLAAPTTPPEGLARIAERTRGFLYFVSVTGARAELPAELPAMLARARQHSRVPVAVGFGVSRPEQAACSPLTRMAWSSARRSSGRSSGRPEPPARDRQDGGRWRG
jgi:tryptophan synthase alpha subunit